MKIRRSLIPILVFLLAASGFAQRQTGNIYGKMVDVEGNPLPGVTITLTGKVTAPVTTLSSVEGNFRFLSLDPSTDYSIKAELKGFKTLSRSNIIVTTNANTELKLTMEQGMLEEEVTVVAASPVVQTKKTTVGMNVDRLALQSLPSARDPWVVLQMTPGVMVDRENVGGSEGGQQSAHFARGGGSTVWSMDGVVITDPAAIASPSYFDFDAFEELNITTGGADVTQLTGGIGLNMVTRRGGNQVSFAGRFYYTDSEFQANNVKGSISDEFVKLNAYLKTVGRSTPGFNTIRAIKDFGFNMGGPLIKDKVWWWLAYGVQDIWTNNLYGVRDDTLLSNYSAKVNAQIVPENRFEAFMHIGNKEKFGRDSSYSFPGGYYQNSKRHFGSPIYKIQDEHMFGDNLLLSAKYSYNDAGFNLTPMDDLNMEKWGAQDVTRGIWYNSYSYYRASRPSHSVYLQANYFNDDLFGLSHEFKVGLEWRKSNGAHFSTWPGNTNRYYNYNTATVDMTGDNKPDVVPNIQYFSVWRGYQSDNNWITGYTGFFSDTITSGRLNMILGFRYDYQSPLYGSFVRKAVMKDSPVWTKNFSTKAMDAIDKFLPGLTVPEVESNYSHKIFSPRLGLTYDVFGDGRTILKLSFSDYGEFMGTGWGGYWAPTGVDASVAFYWFDNNSNSFVDIDELFWRTATNFAPHRVFDDAGNLIGDVSGAKGIMWSGFDPSNPQTLGSARYKVDANAGPTRTREFIFTLERELFPDFGVALDLSYRKFYSFNWDIERNIATGVKESQSEYVATGTIPSTIGSFSTEEAAGKPYYLRMAGVPYRYERLLEPRSDYYRPWYGIELRFTKRLRDKWMLNGSVTYQMQKEHYGDKGMMNITNKWAFEDKIYAPSLGGGSGKISIPGFSKILVKFGGLYQLPYDIDVSFNFNAREGHLVPYYFTLVDYNAPNPYNQSLTVYTHAWGKDRLDFFWNLDLRLEKAVKAGDVGTIYIMADVFNLFNNNMINRRYAANLGTYSMHNALFSPNATNNLINEILNPRIVRFGVRFQFF